MKRQREIIIVIISVFLLTLAWIAFDLYHNAITSTISSTLQQDIQPIDPNFDTQTVQTLKQRQFSSPSYTISSPQQTTATPSGTVQKTSPAPLLNIVPASPSATPTVTRLVTP